jgi:GT2 family glycosyltransferase
VLTFREREMAVRAAKSAEGADSVEVFCNGAAQGDAARIQERWSGGKVKESSVNLSFSAVVNQAASRAADAALLLLTNDAWLEPGALGLLKGALVSDPGLAAVMPLTLRADDPATVHHGGGSFDRRRWAPEILYGGAPRSQAPGSGLRRVDWLDGAAVLYRPGVLHGLPMAEEYGFYWEDVDWGLRAGAKGWGLGVVDGASARHEVSPTTGRFEAWRHYMMARNRLLCARRLAVGPERRVIGRIVLASLLLCLRSPWRLQQRMRLRAAFRFLAGQDQDPPGPLGFR